MMCKPVWEKVWGLTRRRADQAVYPRVHRWPRDSVKGKAQPRCEALGWYAQYVIEAAVKETVGGPTQ